MPKRNQLLSRREVLGTAAGAVFLAPLLRARRLEALGVTPRRLVLAYTPDTHPPEWWPTEGAAGLQLNEPLADFKGLESNLLFVRRLDHAWTVDNHHEAGIAQMFTGERFFNEAQRYANGPSFDQILLKNSDLRGGTSLASIHLSAGGGGGTDKRHVISYSGPGQPMFHEEDAARAFGAVFGGITFGTTPPGATPERQAARARVKRRTIEINRAQLQRLQTHLGQNERRKLDLHVESLFELERGVPPGGSCERVDTSGVTSNPRDATITTRQARCMADIIVNAFRCDRTRVVDFGLSGSGGHHEGLFGLSRSWHDDVAHISRTDDSMMVGDTTMTTRQGYIFFNRFWNGHVAYLAKRLAEIPEGKGTMLDNTVIVWGVDMGTNHSHNPQDIPYLIIGGRNLGIKTGQLLKPAGIESTNKLLTSIMHAFGYPAPGLGIEPTCGPLTGVL